MKNETFIKTLHDLHDRLLALSASKGEEYKGADDNQFGNFERAGIRRGLTREQVLMVYLDKHMESIDTYIRENGVGRNYSESIIGRVDDAILYLAILRAMLLPAAVQCGPGSLTVARADIPNGWTSFQRRLDSTINRANGPLDVAVLLLVPAAASETMEVCRYRKIPIGVNVITSVDQLRGFRGGSVIFVHYPSDSQNTAAYNAAESAYREAIDLFRGHADCSMYVVFYE